MRRCLLIFLRVLTTEKKINRSLEDSFPRQCMTVIDAIAWLFQRRRRRRRRMRGGGGGEEIEEEEEEDERRWRKRRKRGGGGGWTSCRTLRSCLSRTRPGAHTQEQREGRVCFSCCLASLYVRDDAVVVV